MKRPDVVSSYVYAAIDRSSALVNFEFGLIFSLFSRGRVGKTGITTCARSRNAEWKRRRATKPSLTRRAFHIHVKSEAHRDVASCVQCSDTVEE